MRAYEELFAKCSECETKDGTVTGCDHCGNPICLDHDYQPSDYGYDSGLDLCEPCFDRLDEQRKDVPARRHGV